MSTTAIIQARMSSTRLPGKVLAPLGDSHVLGWVIRAARQAQSVDEVVVATSTDLSDDRVQDAAEDLGVPVVRGPLDDVLGRFMKVLGDRPSGLVVRLTADCPLLDPKIIDQCVGLLEADVDLDLATNCLIRTYPRGLDVEVVRKAALERADREATGYHRAHVTSWISTRTDEFRCAGVVGTLDAQDLRVTVDIDADLEVVRRCVAALGADAQHARALVSWLRAHEDVVSLNAHVRPKAAEEG